MLVDARRAERAGGAGGSIFVGAKLFQQPTHHRAAYRRASLVIERQWRGGGGAQLEVVRREGHRVDLSFHAAHERITVAVIVATQAGGSAMVEWALKRKVLIAIQIRCVIELQPGMRSVWKLCNPGYTLPFGLGRLNQALVAQYGKFLLTDAHQQIICFNEFIVH